MKKRLIASITCLSLLLIMLLGSTLAWFTDDVLTTNTMTVGNVKIQQLEQDRYGKKFEQNQKLFPAVITGTPSTDSEGYWTNINNAIDKVVTVKNTGSDPAYVRTLFAFEMVWDGANWKNPLNEKVFLNDKQEIKFETSVIIYRYLVKDENGQVKYIFREDDLGNAQAAFVVGVATYENALDANKTSDPSLLQFYLDPMVNSDFLDAVKGHYEIMVLSQAVQKVGFENVADAMTQAFGIVDAAHAAVWFGTGSYAYQFGKDVFAVSGQPTEVSIGKDNIRGFDFPMYDVKTGVKVGSVVLPTVALKNGDPRSFYATFANSEYNKNITVNSGEESFAHDMNVYGLTDDNEHAVKVELKMERDQMDPDTFKVYHYDTLLESYNYNPNDGWLTFETTSFSPFTVVYDADSIYVPENALPDNVPEATVVNSPEYENVDLPWGSYGAWSPTAGLDSHLEAAYTFSCTETLEEAKENPYANWYCDFVVKLDRELGANQIFLGGNYGSFGWVGFHNGDMTLEANTEIPLLGSVTQNPWTYLEVVQNVGTFICGVGDVNNALAGATFTVVLRLTNPENPEQFIDVATINYTF